MFDCPKGYDGPAWYGNSDSVTIAADTDSIVYGPAEFNVTVAIADTLDTESPCAIISQDFDQGTGFTSIIWPQVPGDTYTILWTDEISTATIWDQVDGPALSDLTYYGYDAWTWTDKGTDTGMSGKPGDVNKRFYMIRVE